MSDYCVLYFNDKKIKFSEKYKFLKKGKCEIKMRFIKSFINMSYMFSDCSSLTSLNLSNFNTNNVKDMSYMFFNCSSLISLNLSNFNTNNVKNMKYMFKLNQKYCKIIENDRKIKSELKMD